MCVKIVMKCCVNYCDIILIIMMLHHSVLKLSSISARVLVVLHTILSMSSKCLVHAWSCCGVLNKDLYILVHWVPLIK